MIDNVISVCTDGDLSGYTGILYGNLKRIVVEDEGSVCLVVVTVLATVGYGNNGSVVVGVLVRSNRCFSLLIIIAYSAA